MVDKLLGATDWLTEKFVDAFDVVADVVSGGVNAILENVGDCISIVLRWLYTLIFEDLFDTCEVYGYKILDFLFSTFAVKSFQFSAIEYVVGFIFLVYVIKLTISLVRG